MLSYKKSTLIPLLLAALILFQNPPWFLWSNSYFFVASCVILLSIICFDRVLRNNIETLNQIPLILSLFAFFVAYASFYQFRASSVVTIITFILLFFINSDEKISALNKLTTALALIITISLVPWLINEYGYSLPFTPLAYDAGKGADDNTILRNYYFFVSYAEGNESRFYSVFDEPGVLGTLAAFILFGNGYNFRDKRNIIILIGGMFSFSLAFYLITLIGMLILNSNGIKKLLKSLILVALLIFTLGWIFSDNETFKYLILNRILDFQDYGIDSRTSTDLNEFFNNFISSPSILLGEGTSFFANNEHLHTGQGYKIFVIEYGITGLVLVALMYLSIGRKNIKILAFCGIIFFISFMQRPFLFTPWQLVIFSLVFENLCVIFTEKTRANSTKKHLAT